ncbi:MAG: sialate O-acetylesterase [Clostridia bacterium]|nr:sialate O-acetylesterase [Clostridia bacterium]
MIIHSFLLIGQSNMAGRGFLHEAQPLDNPSLKMLRNGRWQPLYRPVNGDRPFSGVNLAESFADAYARERNATVGLIPCADGGTTLDQWREGGLLFDHAVYQTRLAQRTSTIAGVLWHQGESDCPAHLWPYYEDKLRAILRAFRETLQLQGVPFLLGGLGDFLPENDPVYASYPQINAALERIAADTPRTGFVSAQGLGSNPDHLHFSAAALEQFGLRYYEQFRRLEDKDRSFPDKPDPDAAFRTAIESL